MRRLIKGLCPIHRAPRALCPCKGPSNAPERPVEGPTGPPASPSALTVLQAVYSEGKQNHNTRCKSWWPEVVKVIQANCKHDYQKQPGVIPPATLTYVCSKCGDDYEKDVS